MLVAERALKWSHARGRRQHRVMRRARGVQLAHQLHGQRGLARPSVAEDHQSWPAQCAELRHHGRDVRAGGRQGQQRFRRDVIRVVHGVDVTALSLGALIGGTILVETVFSWPDVGRAIYDAVVQRDYPMLQGVFVVLTVSVIVLNFIADLVAVQLDPRVAAL